MNIEKAMAKAIRDYAMVHEGDKILIGASGGKDSLALSWLLARFAARGRQAITLGALRVVIGPDVPEGLHDLPEDELTQLYASWAIPLQYFGLRAELRAAAAPEGISGLTAISGCYRCSSLRREILASHARREAYDSIALGHHLDDILTTALMNLLNHGSPGAMKPFRNYERPGFNLIRPLAYVPEESVRRLAAAMGWNSLSCTCVAGTSGDRAEYRRRLEVLCGSRLSAKLRLFRGLGLASELSPR